MTVTLVYALIALLIIVLAAHLTQRRQKEGAEPGKACLGSLWDGPSLALAERVFDSTDYIWLRKEIGQPELAQTLIRSRRRLALQWLQALRRSFEDLVRLPHPLPPQSNPAFSTWQLLWLSLRIRCLLSYAYLVVWLLGPYHQLVPPLDWVPPLLRSDTRRPRCLTPDIGPLV